MLIRKFVTAALAAAASLSVLAAESPTPGVGPTAPGAEPPGDTVLVKRGDVVVTVDDFLAAMHKLPEADRGTYRAEVSRITDLVSSVFLNRALAREAEAEGIDKDPDVQRRLQLQREALLATERMDRFEKTIKAPDYEDRAKELYAASPERWQVADKVKFEHILVSFQGRSRAEALRRVEEARAKLVAKTQTFWRIAKDYSNDPTFRGNDGTIGPVAYATLMPELAAVLKKLPINEVSAPIESSAGFHLVIPLERKAGYTMTYQDVRKSLINAEQAKYRKAQVAKKVSEIVASKDVVMYTDNIALLKTELDRSALRTIIDEHMKAKDEREKSREKAAEKAAQKAAEK